MVLDRVKFVKYPVTDSSWSGWRKERHDSFLMRLYLYAKKVCSVISYTTLIVHSYRCDTSRMQHSQTSPSLSSLVGFVSLDPSRCESSLACTFPSPGLQTTMYVR